MDVCAGRPSRMPALARWCAAWSITWPGVMLAAVAALSDEHPGVVVVTVIDLKE